MAKHNIIIKHKGFDPSPIAGKIPIYADSVNNPKCVTTTAYEEFWLEQIDRCVNGYITAGMNIPGRYYYYLNFVPIKGLLSGRQYPWYVDLDYEFFNAIEYVKKERKPGIIAPKARRRGLSEKGKTILSHGLRFIEGYRGAITAGLETYTNGLRNKFEDVEFNIVPELSLNYIRNNEKTYQIGYHERNEAGAWVERGYGGMISFETMYDDAKKLEGEYFHDVICEESGRYKLLGEVIESIKPALQMGSFTLGTFYIYGTGGNILSTSKDFKEYWDEAEKLGFVRFWVPGTRIHFPFFQNPFQTEPYTDDVLNKVVDPIKNLRSYEPYQVIGCEDVESAEENITERRKEYAKTKNRKKLKEINQHLPLTIEEAFTSGGSNNFNDELIYERLFDIQGDKRNYKEIVLERVVEKRDGILERTMNVVARPARKTDPHWKIIKVYQEPRKEIIDLDVAGVDSYNQDQSQTSSSLGAMVVVRQGNKVNMESQGIHNGQYPVCLYYERPPRKEQFYEICLDIAIWYGLRRNVMCSAEHDFVIDYFKKNGGEKFLSPRPKSFDSKDSKQQHQYGAKMTVSSKPIILGLVQSHIEDYIMYCNFEPMLRDMLAYDEEFIGTDWDSTDALALAIMRIEDMRTRPRNRSEMEVDDELIEWYEDRNGNMRVRDKFIEKDENPGKEIEGNWIPLNKLNYDPQDKDPFD